MKKFIESKSIGYWIAAADAVLALFLGIFYMATYKTAIGNNAGGNIPETVGIFMFAGFVIECVLLALPQYGFINLIALAMYGISFYKEVYLIPDFIAGKVNNVEYNGGSFELNLVYIIFQFIILISAIVATFLGFYKNENAANEDFKIQMNPIGIGKVCGGVLLIAAAVLGGTLATSGVQKKAEEDQQRALREAEEKRKAEEEAAEKAAEEDRIRNTFNPINDDIRAAADAVAYSFDPKSVIIKQEEEYNFSDARLSTLTDSATRTGHNMVYYFEGTYSEGYQGDYSPTYAHMYLWEDGVFYAKASDKTFTGFWYNSSIDGGKDEDGNDIVDCLNMVSNADRYESIITQDCDGFYSKQAYMYLHMSWGGDRSIICNGFMYYPEVAIAINMGVANDHVYHVGDAFSASTIKVARILKDLNFGTIFGSTSATITIPTGMVVDGKLAAAGDYVITATCNGFTATKTITVVE